MAWKIIGNNVIPVNDLREHDACSDCWCHPTDDAGVLVHHSQDRREVLERGPLQ